MQPVSVVKVTFCTPGCIVEFLLCAPKIMVHHGKAVEIRDNKRMDNTERIILS